MSRTGRGWLLAESLLALSLALFLAVRLGISSVWILLPLAVLLLERRRLEDYGLELRITPPSFTTHVLLGAIIFALYGAAHILLARLWAGRVFDPNLPTDLVPLALQQILGVAIPEEFFFRGYLQTNLNRVFGRPAKVFGASVGAGLWLQAALFAICHLVSGDWTRLRVFLFGLLAGWLRERSGSIAAPSLYHGIGNVWVVILDSSLR